MHDVDGARAVDDFFYPLVFRPKRFQVNSATARRDTEQQEQQEQPPQQQHRRQQGAIDASGDSGALEAHTATYRENRLALTATLEWRVPWDLEPGTYCIEVGTGATDVDSSLFAHSAPVHVVGGYTDLVFCLCGSTQHDAEDERSRAYVRCLRCRSWSHTACVVRCWSGRNEASDTFVCYFCRVPHLRPPIRAAALVCHMFSMMQAFSGRYTDQAFKLVSQTQQSVALLRSPQSSFLADQARTPPKLVRFIASVLRRHRPGRADANVLELGAGEGHITEALVVPELFGRGKNCFVERRDERVIVGRAKCAAAVQRSASSVVSQQSVPMAAVLSTGASFAPAPETIGGDAVNDVAANGSDEAAVIEGRRHRARSRRRRVVSSRWLSVAIAPVSIG